MTPRKKQALVVESATRAKPLAGSERSRPARPSQGLVHAAHQVRTTFFTIKLYRKEGSPWDEPVSELHAGQQYRLVLSGSPWPQGQQQGISVGDTFAIRLKCRTDSLIQLQLSLDDACRQFSDTFEETLWELSLPDNLPFSLLTFSVDYLARGSFHATTLDTLSVPVHSAGKLTDPELVDVYQIAAQPTESVAVLVITPSHDAAEKHAFRIRGWSSLRPFQKATSLPAIVSLAELMRKNYEPANIRGKIRIFSNGSSPDLKRWLRALYQVYQDQLSLIVIDQSRQEIPWEMLEIDDEQEDQYLGALCRVVRWLPPKPAYRCRLEVDETSHEGSAIAYVDNKLGAEVIREERDVLRQVATEYATLDDLKERLHHSLRGIGLIYIGCHGDSGATLQKQYPDQLTASELALLRKLPPSPRPIAFINACESGRILESEVNESSFAEILLSHSVGGYIGTLGQVGTAYASYIAMRLLELARQQDGLPIAEMLRRLRAEAVRHVQESYTASKEQKKKSEYEALYTFLYVYYGSPLARLRLYPLDKEEGQQ